jgi:hypothetical protein
MKRGIIVTTGAGLLTVGILALLKLERTAMPLVVGSLLIAAGVTILYLGVFTPRHRLDSLLDFVLRLWP